jgi:hypothetical protein
MQRVGFISTLILFFMATCSTSAYADWWDWLAELSGPGGFHSRGNMTLHVYCWHGPVEDNATEGTTGNARNAHWFHVLQDRNAKGPCVFFDARVFESKDLNDPRWFPTRLEIYDAGPTYRLWTPLEIGVGMGLVHFHSGAVKTDRLIFALPKVTLKPLLLIPAHQRIRNGGFGFFQVYYKAELIQGELTQANFRPKPGTTFRVTNDLVPAAGFLIDPVALVRLIANK